MALLTSRRRFLQMAGIGAGATILAACAPKAEPTKAPEAAAPAEKPAEAKPAPKDPILIKFGWRTNADENAFVEEAIGIFQEQYPEIEVEPVYFTDGAQQFPTMYAAGDAPDTLGTGDNNHADQHLRGQLVSLEEYINTVPGLRDDMWPVGIDTFTWEGECFCLPQVIYYGGVFLNTTLFDEAGVDRPPFDWNVADTEWTWSDMVELAGNLTKDSNGDGKVNQYGINIGHWSPWTFTRLWGQDLVSEEDYSKSLLTKFRLDETDVYDACVGGLQARADNMHVHQITPSPATSTSLSEMGPMLKTGAVSMDFTGGWAIRGALPEQFGFAAAIAPQGGNNGEGTRGYQVWVDPFKIISQTEHPDEAWQWIYWLAADAEGGVPLQNERLGLTPGIRSGLDGFLKTMAGRLDMSEDDFRTFVVSGLETATSDCPCHILAGHNACRDIIRQELEPLWQGEITAKEAVDSFYPLVTDQIEKSLESLGLS